MLALCALCASGALSEAQGWKPLPLAVPVKAPSPDLSQRFLVTDIPVTGKAKKFLVTVSGHVGQASISLLTEAGQDALYVFIESETEHVGNLRFTLPVDMAEGDDHVFAMLGTENEAMFELPDDAEITLTIRARELEYQGRDVKELQSEFEVRHTLVDGTSVTQKLKLVPSRLVEHDGQKIKDMLVEFERRERTKRGKRSSNTVRFELRELRSEDFEGREGGPPVFVSRS